MAAVSEAVCYGRPSVPVSLCRLSELFKLANARLGYLRVVTPKHPDDDRAAGRFVVVDGKVVDGAAAAAEKAAYK